MQEENWVASVLRDLEEFVSRTGAPATCAALSVARTIARHELDVTRPDTARAVSPGRPVLVVDNEAAPRKRSASD